MRKIWSKIERSLTAPIEGPGWAMLVAAAIVGALAGLVAVVFDSLVRLSESFFFGSIAHHTFTGWKILFLLPLPALGGLGVGLFTVYVARAKPGHGIPDVVEALARDPASLRGRTGLYKMITASLTIGSGGSAGQEGPIVQIGAVVGAVVTRLITVNRESRNTLVACGAAAGLAAIFNAPLAGFVFVLEIILRDFSLRRSMPVVVAAVMGVATCRLFHPDTPIFAVPTALHNYPFAYHKIVPFIVLGLLCGVMGYAFTASYHWFEHKWSKLPVHPALRPALGGVVLGVMGIIFVLGFGLGQGSYEPPVFFANGYPVIHWLFDPRTYVFHGGTATTQAASQSWGLFLAFLLAALVCKVVGTSMTLGSGGSGGLFAPSLFMGATLGGALGMVVQLIPGFHDVTPANFAVVGMAGVLAGAVHCPMTSFLLVFEITSDYRLILPAMLVAVLATSISKLFTQDSIYTITLREHGVKMGASTYMAVLRRIEVAATALAPAVIVHPQDPAERLVDLSEKHNTWDFVVCDDQGHYAGLVLGDDLRPVLVEREALPVLIVGELMRRDVPPVSAKETLEDALEKFTRHDASCLAVVDGQDNVVGTVTRAKLMRQSLQALEAEE